MSKETLAMISPPNSEIPPQQTSKELVVETLAMISPPNSVGDYCGLI